MYRILALNPGSTSTKIALFENEKCVLQHSIEHSQNELAKFTSVMAQEDFRRSALLKTLEEHTISLESLSALVVRGGLLKPLAGGIYQVNEKMAADLKNCTYGQHASNLGAVIALPLSRNYEIPLLTVDPVTVDEFEDTARFSGLKGINRLSMSHALNMKAVSRKTAKKLGQSYGDINLVVAHLGSGISVSAHRKGRMIDVNNANNEGPFSLERCGTLPAISLINLCFNGGHSEREMIALVTGKGGIFSYLGTKDFRLVEKLIGKGDEEAHRVVDAMAYQVSKEIGAMAAVLKGLVDRIVLTGGMAHSSLVTEPISQRVSFIAPVVIFPGEEEMNSLAEGALRSLRGEEKIRTYA